MIDDRFCATEGIMFAERGFGYSEASDHNREREFSRPCLGISCLAFQVTDAFELTGHSVNPPIPLLPHPLASTFYLSFLKPILLCDSDA